MVLIELNYKIENFGSKVLQTNKLTQDEINWRQQENEKWNAEGYSNSDFSDSDYSDLGY